MVIDSTTVNIASQLGIVGRPAARKCEPAENLPQASESDNQHSGLLRCQSSSNKHDPVRRNRRKATTSHAINNIASDPDRSGSTRKKTSESTVCVLA